MTLGHSLHPEAQQTVSSAARAVHRLIWLGSLHRGDPGTDHLAALLGTSRTASAGARLVIASSVCSHQQ